jgi:uncharacterized protein
VKNRRLASITHFRRALGVSLLLALALTLIPGAAGSAGAAAAKTAGYGTTVKSPKTNWPGGTWNPDPAKYGDLVVPNVRIRMSDGVYLVGDVEYPTNLATGKRASGKFPVLLTQNPYECQEPVGVNPAATLNPTHDFFVDRGYIFATICVRGTGRSGGKFLFFGTGRVAEDGATLVSWAAHELAGSNGKVGLTGCSFLGFTQLFTAALLSAHSPVKEISPFCTGASTYREDQFAGGMPTQTTHLRSTAFYSIIGEQGGDWGAAYYQNLISGGPDAYDGALAKTQTAGDVAAKIVRNNIPALLWSGWADIYAEQSEELYADFQNAYFGRPTFGAMKPGDRTTGRYQIVEGPWAHGVGINEDIQLEWFDTWLKGQGTGMVNTPTPMHLWDATAEQWINTATYPMTRSYTPYYLGPDGTFTSYPPSTKGSNHITWAQPDVTGSTLTYTSVPFARGATLAGPIGASLYASSSNTNLELIATLSEVAPNGTVTYLTSGPVIGSLAKLNKNRSWYDTRGLSIRPYITFDKDRYLTPGLTKKFEFWISPYVATIAPGDKLQLELSTQTPTAACAALIGTDPCYPTAPQQRTLPGGKYIISFSSARPSLINLPLFPYKFFKDEGGGAIPLNWG